MAQSAQVQCGLFCLVFPPGIRQMAIGEEAHAAGSRVGLRGLKTPIRPCNLPQLGSFRARGLPIASEFL